MHEGTMCMCVYVTVYLCIWNFNYMNKFCDQIKIICHFSEFEFDKTFTFLRNSKAFPFLSLPNFEHKFPFLSGGSFPKGNVIILLSRKKINFYFLRVKTIIL